MTTYHPLGLPVTAYGLYVMGALLVCYVLSFLYLNRKGVAFVHQAGYGLCMAFFAWLMARVVYALCSIPTYLNEYDGYFLPALYFWDGGYAMTGAVLGMTLGAWVASKMLPIARHHALNAAGLAIPAGVMVLRLAEFMTDTPFSGDIGEGDFVVEGPLTDFLARTGLLMQADGDFCYPACLLAMLFAQLVLVGLLIWSYRRKENGTADVLLVSLALFALTQLVAEPLRDDGHLTFHFVPFQQVIALLIFVGVLIIWIRRACLAGQKKAAWLTGGIALICIVVAIIASFMIDRYENKVVAWSLLIGPVVLMGMSSLLLRWKTTTEI